jgi:hypothetical protein
MKFFTLNLNTAKDKHLRICARLYASSSRHPVYAEIQTQESGTNRFPQLEGVLADLRTQPFIHDCPITIYEANHIYTFRLFCKNHRLLPVNGAIRQIAAHSQWKGDILIMRSGKKRAVVNMRSRDAALADFAVKR